jgi:hypothetical protein
LAVKRTLSESSVKLRVNIKELLDGKNLPDDPDIVEAIAQKAIDIIVERTQDGVSLSGRPFKKYSDSYQKSVSFKAFGKSSTPNLTLSGDMLDLLELIDTTRNTFEIGWTDDLEIKKAYNHNVGDTVPKREFFGLQKQELDELREFAESLIKDEASEE